jgi:GGDEF domain-containing protein
MTVLSTTPFVEAADLELKRAERYRIFVSVVLVDLRSSKRPDIANLVLPFNEILDLVQRNIRAFDRVAVVEDNRLALLLPETSRQGAEATARRLTSMIRDQMAKQSEHMRDQTIPLEMASYPDAAGTRSVAEVLKELADANPN